MKVSLAVLIILLLIIPVHSLKAQAFDLNINNVNHNSHYDIKSESKNFFKLASPNSQIYLPDELILYSMEDSVRLSATYTPNGSNDQILTQVWYSGHWVNYERSTWTSIDSTTESNLTLRQIWVNGQWQNTELDSSTYDVNGNMLVHLFSYWSNGQWQDSLLSSRTYDVNGNMLTNIGWVMLNSQWTNSWRGTYTYDANGDELTFLDEIWSNGQWVNMNLWTSTYDENGNMLTRTMQVWNGQWENATLSTYTYDANGNMLSFLLQNSANGQWTNHTINTYTYDANGKMLTDWYKGWTNGAWMNGSLYTYTYNPNGKLINKLIQYWLNGFWTNFYQTVYNYDSNMNMITGNNTIWTGSAWEPYDNDFELNINGDIYYFTGYGIAVSYILINTTDVLTDNNGIVKEYSLSQNYPNPFNPSTVINYQLPATSYVTLKVYDVLGREIKTLVDEQEIVGNYSVTFNASNLASGTYFYRIQAGNFVQTNKFIVLK